MAGMPALRTEPVTAFAPGPSLLRVAVQPAGRCSPPGLRGPHSHEFFALVYAHNGGGWHRLNGRAVEVRPGDLLAIPAGTVHDLGGIEPGDGTTIAFMPDAVNPRAANGTPLPGDARWAAFLKGRGRAGIRLTVPDEQRSWFAGLIRALGRELEAQRLGYEAAARAQLSLILVCVARLAEPELADGVPLDPVLRDLFDLIDARFRDPLSLEQLAAAVSRSPRHLSRTVREVTGETVIQLVDHRRMQEARRLLLETDANVDTVGYAVGYQDASHFRRRFRKAHGLPPSAWRQMNR